jgi:hypothetical protein
MGVRLLGWELWKREREIVRERERDVLEASE